MARLPKGEGRKRIQLKKIENERERAVTFTKRHRGLFKKANELATLCGTQIAVIVFSLSGKPISFGSPNVPFIINKFLNLNQVNQHDPDDFVTRFNESTVQGLNKELDELNEQLANEKKRGQMSQERLKEKLGWESYDKYLGSLGIHELMQMKCKLEAMKRQIECKDDDDDEVGADLSKITAPEDYLKL